MSHWKGKQWWVALQEGLCCVTTCHAIVLLEKEESHSGLLLSHSTILESPLCFSLVCLNGGHPKYVLYFCKYLYVGMVRQDKLPLWMTSSKIVWILIWHHRLRNQCVIPKNERIHSKNSLMNESTVSIDKHFYCHFIAFYLLFTATSFEPLFVMRKGR